MKPNLSERQKRAISSFFAVIIVVTLPATSLAGIQPVRAEHQNPESDLLDYTQTSLGPHVNIPNNHEINFTDLPETNLAAIYESQDFDTEGKTIIMRFTLEITDCTGSTPTFYVGITEIDTVSDQSQLSGLGVRCQEMVVVNTFDTHNFHKSGDIITNINQNQEYDIELRYNYGSANMTIEVGQESITAQYPAAKKANIVPFVSQNSGSSSDTISGRITDYSLNLVDIKNIGQDFNTYTAIDGSGFNYTENWISGSFQPDDGYGLYKNGAGTNSDNYRLEYEIFISQSSANALLQVGPGYTQPKTVLGTLWEHDRLSQNNDHFGETASVDPSEQKYYVSEFFYYSNGTHITKVYNDKDKSSVFFEASNEFPAGENYTTLWAFNSFAAQNADIVFNIGNMEVNRVDNPNKGDNLTSYTKTSSGYNVTENWVSFNQPNGEVFNNSGPGLDTGKAYFALYVHSGGLVDFGYAQDTVAPDIGFLWESDGSLSAYPSGNQLISSLGSESWFYFILEKRESTYNLEVYSDPERTNLLASESGNYDNTDDYEYIFAMRTGSSEFTDANGMIHWGNTTQNVIFPEPFSGNITLDVNPWMDHGDTQEYEVLLDNGSNVASQSTVTSGNTTVITVNSGTQELEATSDEGIAEKVEISAEFGDATDTENVTVANRTVGNIGILPPSQRPGAVIGIDDPQAAYGIGSEIQWILLAVFIGAVGAWKARNEWIGVGVITGALILFWTVGHVSLGYTIVGVFYAIFTGYQLVRTPSRSDTNVGAGLR